MKLNVLKGLAPKRPGWQVGAAIAFIAAGFIAIVKAWDGAANLDFAQGQIPYLLSGGAAGIGLIMVGVALMIFEMGRRDRIHLDSKLDALTKAIEDLRAAGNGAAAAVAAPARGRGRATEANVDGLVVAGVASYHRPECRLVTGKTNQEFIPADEAVERGLAPCRVCSPQVAEPRGSR